MENGKLKNGKYLNVEKPFYPGGYIYIDEKTD